MEDVLEIVHQFQVTGLLRASPGPGSGRLGSQPQLTDGGLLAGGPILVCWGGGCADGPAPGSPASPGPTWSSCFSLACGCSQLSGFPRTESPSPASAVVREELLPHKDANPTWQSPGSVAALWGHCIQPFPGAGKQSLTILCPPDDGFPDSPQNHPKWNLRRFRAGAGCLGNLRTQVQFFIIYEPTGRGLLLGLLTNHPP